VQMLRTGGPPLGSAPLLPTSMYAEEA
jgi:hypothetical protein